MAPLATLGKGGGWKVVTLYLSYLVEDQNFELGGVPGRPITPEVMEHHVLLVAMGNGSISLLAFLPFPPSSLSLFP